MTLATLNEAFSTLSMRRRYEVWFLRLGLADGSGAWWFRYLLMDPGRGGCAGNSRGAPVQLWATWFPTGGKPQTFLQGFALDGLELSRKGQQPFHLRLGSNRIEENSCRGALEVDGHSIAWDLRYQSTFRVTMSYMGCIGFSRTPHSDGVFSGEIKFDDRTFAGNELGFGVQGHNCGYRHRNFWTWTHAYFPRKDAPATTLEALVYDMPLGLLFRKAVLWHDGVAYVFRSLKESGNSHRDMLWSFQCESGGIRLQAEIDGRGEGVHRLPYLKTDCSGTFEVANNSLASATVLIERAGRPEKLETTSGAVLEVVG